MARSRFNSPLLPIAWTDAVSGNRRSSFDPALPVELRIGLVFEPPFWGSFVDAIYDVHITTYRFGYVAHWFNLMGNARELPGAPGLQLWIGLELGRAEQANVYDGEPVSWGAKVWFERVSTASFVGSAHERRTGGAGTPPGTPTLP